MEFTKSANVLSSIREVKQRSKNAVLSRDAKSEYVSSSESGGAYEMSDHVTFS